MNHTPGPWNIEDIETVKMSLNQRTGAECSVIADGAPQGYKLIAMAHGRTVAHAMANATILAAAPDLLAALEEMNHMGGDDRGGYCICPLKDGSASDRDHATVCKDARQAIAKATAAPAAKDTDNG